MNQRQAIPLARPGPPFWSDKATYRPDIDGLRAVAVMSVVLCHAKLGLSGGFVGVDVFFVISGYLITGLILRDLRQNTFSMVAFWERRARRILPALLVVALATCVLAWFLLFPGEFRAFGNTLAALAVGASNIQLWREAGYFDTAAQYKLLLHTWSLAVEEQFYLATPLLLWALYRRLVLKHLLVVLCVFAAASLALSIAGTRWFPSWNFYMLPSRGWELLLGSILSLLPGPRRNRARELTAAVGAAAILVPCIVYDESTRFPGLAALPVAMGTAALIWSGTVRAEGQTWVGKFLELRPLVWIGLISYSLYLWHWPLLVLGHHFGELPLATRLALVGASVVAAALSWRFVELPFRRRTRLPKRMPLFAAAVSGLLMMFLFGMAVRQADGFPTRFRDRDRLLLHMAEVDRRYIHEVRIPDVAERRLPRMGSLAAPPRMLVWGDSHAMAFLPAIDEAARRLGVGALVATHTSNPPVTDFVYYVPNGFNENSIPFNQAVLERALQGDLDVVVLSGKWELYLRDARFLSRLQATVAALQDAGVRVVLVLDVPRFPFYVPHRVFLAKKVSADISSIALDSEEVRKQRRAQDAVLASLKDRQVQVVDPWDTFLRRSTDGRFPAGDAGGVFYRDDDHLSTYGALLLTPLFEETFRESGLAEPRAASTPPSPPPE